MQGLAELGLIDQFDALQTHRARVTKQKNYAMAQQAMFEERREEYKQLKHDLLKDVERKIWNLIKFFITLSRLPAND